MTNKIWADFNMMLNMDHLFGDRKCVDCKHRLRSREPKSYGGCTLIKNRIFPSNHKNCAYWESQDEISNNSR